ncbi:GH25 family lysozyme [Plantactinospora siamensis]|uniref:GH25 family lysozyme n=1 Tax=Plantactinospora siamensis TaxID=555372 RepID=A0ABV6P542_9ACTN
MAKKWISALVCAGLVFVAGQPARAGDSAADGGGYAHAGVAPGLRASATAATAAAPSGYTIKGIDVSSHDHTLGAIDWPAQAAGGVSFAYVKATEGTYYVNPYFDGDNRDAKAAGILVGAYHYARPDKKDPVNEANYFIDHAQWVKDSQTLVPFLDLEWPYGSLNLPACWGLSTAELTGYIRSFANQVQARIGRKLMIYTNTNWWNPCTGNSTAFGDLPLDIAGYTASLPPLPSGWSSTAVWQYAAGNNSQQGNYDKDVFSGDYPALTRLAGGAPASQPPLGLRAWANGKYVTAESGGRNPLIARATELGLWEEYDLVNAGAGFVALRSRSNGKYVTADGGGSKALIANRSTIGLWEEFTLVDNSDGSVSLRAHVNGRYVTADGGGSKALIANRTAIGAWEKFDRYAVPRMVTLKSVGVGNYVTAERAGTAPLIARAAQAGLWEQYDLVDAGHGYVALRSHANNRYVTAESAGTKPLIANRTAVGPWEQFAPVDNPDGTVSLMARVNEKYVTALSGAQLIASGTAVADAQEFQLGS